MTQTADLEMLNPRHLADLTGKQLNTVYQWRKRRATNGMPDPDKFIGRAPLWKPETIVPWLRATNRLT